MICDPYRSTFAICPARVHNLDTALQAYWAAQSPQEDTAAYHQILLFGGIDGYPSQRPWRITLARWLRKLALRVDGLGV